MFNLGGEQVNSACPHEGLECWNLITMGMGPLKIGVTAAIALLVIGIVLSMAPAIGGTVEDATPTLGATSSWNSSYNTDMQTGGDFFADYFPFVGLVIMGLLAAIIIGMWIRM